MTEKYLIESGVLRVKTGKFEKDDEKDAIYAAYKRLIEKEFGGDGDILCRLCKHIDNKDTQSVPTFLDYHEKVVELFKDERTSPELYKEALKLERLEDNVAKHLPEYLQNRQKVEFMEACLNNPRQYDYLCATRGKDVEDKSFRLGVEKLYNDMADKFSALQDKFFDEFVEFNVREDVRFAAINEKTEIRHA